MTRKQAFEEFPIEFRTKELLDLLDLMSEPICGVEDLLLLSRVDLPTKPS